MKQKDPVLSKQSELAGENNSGRDTRESSKIRTGNFCSHFQNSFIVIQQDFFCYLQAPDIS